MLYSNIAKPLQLLQNPQKQIFKKFKKPCKEADNQQI